MIDDGNIATIDLDGILRSFVSIDSVDGAVEISLGRDTPFGAPAFMKVALDPAEFVNLFRQVVAYAMRTSTAAISLPDASDVPV